MLIGFSSFECPRRLSAVGVDVLGGACGGRSRSERRSVVGVACLLEPVDQHLEAGGEPLVAVVDPDVFAQGDQGGEAVWGQGAEELVQLGSDGVVTDALLVDRGGRAADGEPNGVVDQQEEGEPGFAVAEPGRLQRPQEGLG
jgi:hypothetical protein